METKEVKTTGGYTATLNAYLTYDQFVELQKVWTNNTLIDPTTGAQDLNKVPANLVYDAQKLAIGFLVKSITGPDGAAITRDINSLPIPPQDGQEIVDAINALTKEAADAFSKKKQTA